MGLSILSVFIIQSNDVRCEAGGPVEDNKWVGWVMKDGHPLLNTEPVYDSHDEAVQAMKKLVDVIRKLEIPKPGELIPDKITQVITSIIYGSKNKIEDLPKNMKLDEC